MTDAAQSSSDIVQMRKAMRDTKGLGNFRNLFMYAPNGKPDGIKILPLSEVATKDDFFKYQESQPERFTLCAPRTTTDDGDYPREQRRVW